MLVCLENATKGRAVQALQTVLCMHAMCVPTSPRKLTQHAFNWGCECAVWAGPQQRLPSQPSHNTGFDSVQYTQPGEEMHALPPLPHSQASALR